MTSSEKSDHLAERIIDHEGEIQRLSAQMGALRDAVDDLGIKVDQVNAAIGEVVCDMHGAKIGGRVALGIAATLGAAVTAAIAWFKP
jgi:hypothetical protein